LSSLSDTPADARAVLLATRASADGAPAALLPWEGGTLLARLAGQLADLGVSELLVVTRPGWEPGVAAEIDGAAPRARVVVSPALDEDLRHIARHAGAGGAVVLLHADIVTQPAALGRLLADPRVGTGILAGGGELTQPATLRVHTDRGRALSASSAYHSVRQASAPFLGVLKVDARDLPALAATGERLAELAAAPPPSWEHELERKTAMWRRALARRAAGRERDDDQHDGAAHDGEAPATGTEPAPLSDADEARLRDRVAAARDDAVALLLVGLVRSGARVGVSQLRTLYWARPASAADAALAAERITAHDEERDRLDSAVKSSDGFFTTFFVSPYSRYIARWAARRGLTPNHVTVASMVVGALAATAFATGERWGLVAGAVLLQAAFTLDCVDGQLARYTRTFSEFGAWLDSTFDRAKEYLVFAGLAIGASRAGDPVWLLAGCALTLQTVRHMADFSFGAVQQREIAAAPLPPLEQPSDGPPRREPALPAASRPRRPSPVRRVLRAWQLLDRAPSLLWVRKMIAFPIGERFALISLTAALFTPRTAFIALLSWGGVATLYTLTGRVLRSLAR
jgi:choline kinase